MLNLPNIITVFRILLVPFFIMVLLHYRETGADAFRWCALAIFVGAGASDALDGFLARVRNQKTVLGSFLDPLADKLLLISAVLMLSLPLGRIARLPSWFPVLVISRDVVIVLGSALIHILAGRLAPTPVASGKCTTFLQMLTVVWCLARVPQHLLPLYLASAFTVISGVEYIILGLRQLQRVNSSDPRP